MIGSIRRRLMLLVLASVGLVWLAATVSSYRQAVHEVGEWEDTRLEQVARTLMLIDAADLRTLAARGIGGTDDDGDDESSHPLLFEVRTADGTVLAASRGLTAAARATPDLPRDGEQSTDPPAHRWLAYELQDGTLGRTVRVFERSDMRSDLATGVARRVARPLAFALPVLALLVWFSIGRSLAPLKTLSRAIRRRNADNLDPIDMRGAPAEVGPLVDALNSLLARLRGSLDRERAFTADAAHELKTPLAAIKVQAQVAMAETDHARQQIAMQRVVEGVDRSTHLADQLLLLARLDEGTPVALERVDLDALARDRIAAHAAEAARLGIALTLREHGAASTDAAIDAAPTLVAILLDNLIDNAFKYAGAGRRVEVEIGTDGARALLAVRDDGPGVTAADRARLADRFFRVTGTRARGSGLGLSIVARIAARFGGQLSFADGIGGSGLGVEVRWPPSGER